MSKIVNINGLTLLLCTTIMFIDREWLKNKNKNNFIISS